MVTPAPNPKRPTRWIAGCRKALGAFPESVRREIGFALYFAQKGDKHPSAKPLRGFKSAGVLEVVENYHGDTYRAVYTVRFANVVYVLHVFQKKSKSGIKTPRSDIELINARLKMAETDYRTFGGNP